MREYAERLRNETWFRDRAVLAVAEFYSGEISAKRGLELAENVASDSTVKCDGSMMYYCPAMPHLIEMDFGSYPCPIDTGRASAYLEESLSRCKDCEESEFCKPSVMKSQRLRNFNSQK
jgi:hypothetical protein